MSEFSRIALEAPKGRLLVTSDIHGHIRHLKAVLEKAGFCESDKLLIVGDLLDKGPDSLGTLRYAMELVRSGRAIVLMGNVDKLRLDFMRSTIENSDRAQEFLDYINYMNNWKGTCFYSELFAELGIVPDSLEVIAENAERVYKHFLNEFDFIASLPTLAESEKYIFIHGGIPEGEELFLATADGEKEVIRYLKTDAFRDRALERNFRFTKHIVCGHWPVLNYGGSVLCCNPNYCEKTNIISIDGGCGIAQEGQLNLLAFPYLDCNQDEIVLYSYDELDTVTALEYQPESDDPFSVTWPDNEVRFLSRSGDVAQVLHIASGRVMKIPTRALWKDVETLTEGDVSRIRQSTDYCLGVDIGDTLSMILKTDMGILAKKNGLTGWYMGKYE